MSSTPFLGERTAWNSSLQFSDGIRRLLQSHVQIGRVARDAADRLLSGWDQNEIGNQR